MRPKRLLLLLSAACALALLRGCGCGAVLSGLYADNGLDQTEMMSVLTSREKRQVEREILSLLGLSRRPRAAPAAPLAGSAPKFLLGVYESLLEPAPARAPVAAPVQQFNLSGYDLNVIDKSDVIMGFVSHSGRAWSPGVRHGRGQRLWFDVSEVPGPEQLLGAELRLFQAPAALAAAPAPAPGFTVTLYQLVPTPDDGEELQLVDSVNTTLGAHGWLLFNVSGPLASWAAFPSANLGLYLSVRPAAGRARELHPDEIGIVSEGGDEDREPFMVGFFKSSGHRETHVRTTRDTSRRRRKSYSSPADANPLQAAPHYQWASRSCQMLELYVNFKDLHWQDWIIAPAGFQAFYCSGECNFPLNAHMNATNHAIVQTLVHLMNPLKVPKPCCAPTKLGPIQILYYLEDSNVTLKKYKNMVVKSCGCH